MPVSVRRTESRRVLMDRARGAYLGLAAGDALGATVEFMTPREIESRHGRHADIVGGGWLRLKRGRVTDDTEMSLALGHAILESGGVVDAEAAARAFSDWMRTKPVDIGHTVRRGIVRFRTQGVVEGPVHAFEAGNGAAMRVLPVALATLGGDPAEIARAIRAQAHVTHNNPLSDAGCDCIVAMVQDALGNGTPPAGLLDHARDLTARFPEFAWAGRPRDNPSGFIVETLQAVFQAMETGGDAGAILVEVVNRGGDADTTGAIAGMIVGASAGVAGLPVRWLRRLDRSVVRACAAQAEALVALSPAGVLSDPAVAGGRSIAGRPRRLSGFRQVQGPTTSTS